MMKLLLYITAPVREMSKIDKEGEHQRFCIKNVEKNVNNVYSSLRKLRPWSHGLSGEDAEKK